ncbi:unnamed protein product [Effrenium voratum]|uniref:Uncharacterized protein n=1 Tax=Effrenium voratum TaxID=2562239 RepID=A0AA36JL28_9DINO|nr:unnamed protein product [Effrenium voratum]
MLLLNPFDSWLPAPLSLDRAAIFLERALEPGAPLPPDVLEEEDFEKSWSPRSHTDRGDGVTTVCASHLAPRALPKDCDFGKQLLQAWISSYVQHGAVPGFDGILTKMYKAYVRTRQQTLADDSCAVVLLPGWSLAEPHFPDGFRYFGRRGSEDELEDRPHFHSQLFSARAHKERADWVLVRSLKMFLPLDYGPPSARNVLPRSVVDMAQRMLSVRGAAKPMHFGVVKNSAGRHWRTPVDMLDMMQNSMVQTFDAGQPKLLPREAALPGNMGGFRTFRDVRVVGTSSCGRNDARVSIQDDGKQLRFYCRTGVRVEAGQESQSYEAQAAKACRQALSVDKGRFELSGSPAWVNAAMSLLAFDPLPGRSRSPEDDLRLTEAELQSHFTNLSLSLGTCGTSLVAKLEALLDDVEEHMTVVAHSASRCELLDRLGASFRTMYGRLPVLVTCECPEAAGCLEPSQRRHPAIPYMSVIDVPFDFGLSRGKKLLVSSVNTEFILVLDDDFVRSPLSCLECMLWHMRSRLHSLTLPFDMLGFPILEDERNFGAFRGRLRATSNRLYLDPIVAESAADGCTRVGIHPMAFLGRTARLRGFKFQDNLQVGEHEQFFYSNKYLGLHAAVCFDSTFPHFRVKMKGLYKQRRDRMQELMTAEFTKVGFPSMMYLLQKYDILNGADHAEFLSKDVPPWHISDDTCGPQPDPPADFAMFFAAIFSSASDRSAQFRNALRGEHGQSSNVWLPKLMELSAVRWAFFLDENAASGSIMDEEAEYGDLVFMPSKVSGAEQLRWCFAFLQRFQFRWLLLAQEDTFINAMVLFGVLSGVEQAWGNAASRTVVGKWTSNVLSPELVVLTQDVFHLLASSRLVRWLRTDDGDGYGQALNAWLAPLAIQKEMLPGVYTGQVGCPLDASVLHPVELADLLLLSDAATSGAPCEVLADMRTG